MRELVVIEFMTLDGVVQAPGHAGEDTDDGFAQGGWTQPYMVDHRQFGAAEYVHAGDFLFGRRTYQIWLPHWSAVTDPDDSIAVALNSRPKYVASSTLEDASWPGTTIIARNDLERTVQQLKSQQGGPIVVPGSGQLVHSLTAAKLVDRYQLWIHPVAVGAGKRLFNEAVALRPVHSTSTPTGVTILELEPETATAAISGLARQFDVTPGAVSQWRCAPLV